MPDRNRPVRSTARGLKRLPGLALLPLLCLAAAAGCVRTPDGSVTVASELDMGRYWKQPPQPPQTPPVESGSAVFPVPPSAGWSRPARRIQRTARRVGQPAVPLACHDAARDGSRARVVCE